MYNFYLHDYKNTAQQSDSLLMQQCDNLKQVKSDWASSLWGYLRNVG